MIYHEVDAFTLTFLSLTSIALYAWHLLTKLDEHEDDRD